MAGGKGRKHGARTERQEETGRRESSSHQGLLRRLAELQDMRTETSKPEKQREKRQKQEKTNQNTQGPWDNYKDVPCALGTPGRRRQRNREASEAIVTDDLPELRSNTKPEIRKFRECQAG